MTFHAHQGYQFRAGIFVERSGKLRALALAYEKGNSRGKFAPVRLHMLMCREVPPTVKDAAKRSRRAMRHTW
jgi:hypothetical protein